MGRSDPLNRSLNECTIQGGGWAKVFERPPQPMLRIKTECGTVWELGGAVIQTYGNPRIELNDWSVLAQYYKPNTPMMTYANTLEELEGTYLHPLVGRHEGSTAQTGSMDFENSHAISSLASLCRSDLSSLSPAWRVQVGQA